LPSRSLVNARRRESGDHCGPVEDFLPLVSCAALAGRHHRDPDLLDEIVLVPIGLLDGIGDKASVGRDLRARDRLHAERFIDRGDTAGREGGSAKNECRDADAP
jgi:hypothetical protein